MIAAANFSEKQTLRQSASSVPKKREKSTAENSNEKKTNTQRKHQVMIYTILESRV